MITYSEIVEKLRNGEEVSKNDITGEQLWMLLIDRNIQSVKWGNILYKLIFIPVHDHTKPDVFIINEEMNKYNDGEKIFINVFNKLDNGERVYIFMTIEDEYYRVERVRE